MEVSSDINGTVTSPQKKPEKFEDEKQGISLFPCTLCDTEIVRKIAQSLLPGIATACVDNTSGDLFKTPASVAADLRREMVEYVTRRSETFVADSVAVEGGPEAAAFAHPHDVISDLVDDFAGLKRNLFSRVSGWLLSEKREDKIDDFVQEMVVNGFWLTDARESVARALIKNIDFRNMYHCNASFDSPEELAGHAEGCDFRPTTCGSEGCDSVFSTRNAERHGLVCPFKVIPCEQNCSARVMRREMDRHCITICVMRLVSCPFYALGCQTPIPHRELGQHRSNGLRSHLLCVLRSVHKKISMEDLKRRADQVENASLPGQLEKAQDVRSLTSVVKELEAKLGPYKPNGEDKAKDETTENPTLLSNREN